MKNTVQITMVGESASAIVQIRSSNLFMMKYKLNKLMESDHILSWNITTPKWTAGNFGLNAMAYLVEFLETI